ncbi:DUF58 domain-containing protein [Candidatus Babeliales bacterium]|nr:DUF58 domain-containing protein [Candidatus Babeliales bacterium]
MMLNPEIMVKVKELELHTRKILSGSLIGGSKTRQKGFGFDFDQLRPYQYGDDVRLIDWKSSARNFNNLLVRQYFEDRNRTIIICLDISASVQFGSTNFLKSEIMQQVAGVLAMAGAWSSDKVGLILFSDSIEKSIPAIKGFKHVHGLLYDMFDHKPEGKGTNFEILSEYIVQHIAKQAMIFVISDFINVDIAQTFKKISYNKELIAICCNDRQEEVLSDVGLVWMQDPETGEIALVNSSGSNRSYVNKGLSTRLQNQKSMFYQAQMDVLYLHNFDTIMHDVLAFFQKRML